MHNRSLKTSKELQRLHALLKRKSPTTLEIHEATGSMAPSTLVSELRHSGIPVVSRYIGKSGEGKKIFKYSLY